MPLKALSLFGKKCELYSFNLEFNNHKRITKNVLKTENAKLFQGCLLKGVCLNVRTCKCPLLFSERQRRISRGLVRQHVTEISGGEYKGSNGICKLCHPWTNNHINATKYGNFQIKRGSIFYFLPHHAISGHI